MIVTQIEELSRSRSKIYIEQGSAFVLYKGELRLYHIRVGEEIAPEDYRAIMDELLPKRAKLRAMNLLKNREYTCAQLAGKLRQGLYPEPVIEEALDYVASFHYTDDLRYAVDYITGHETTRGRRRIEQDLRRKGIDEETVQRAWKEWEEQGGEQNEEEIIRNLLQKRHYDPEQATWEERQKQGAYLMRKGFSAEDIRRTLQMEI